MGHAGIQAATHTRTSVFSLKIWVTCPCTLSFRVFFAVLSPGSGERRFITRNGGYKQRIIRRGPREPCAVSGVVGAKKVMSALSVCVTVGMSWS